MTIISRIQEGAEELLPAHIMSLAIERLYAEGYEIRLDTRGYLENAVRATLRKFPGEELLVCRKVDSLADDVMRPITFSDTKTVLLAASYLILKLVEEKMYLDPKNQAVLSAIMITLDADEDDNPETHSLIAEAKDRAGKMLSECLRLGLYCHAVVTS